MDAMSNDSRSTVTSRRSGAPLLALLALTVACAAPERVAAPAVAAPVAAPAHSLLLPLLGLVGTVGHLVECTLPDVRTRGDTAVIGAEGGSLAVGRTHVEIPAGAVSSPETFVLTVPATSQVQVEVHAIGYEHYQFAAPVAVTVDYGRCGDLSADGNPLHAWYVEGSDARAIEDMGGVADPIAQTLTFRTPHFSVYMLAE
jgi:hypothetical protein